MEVIPPTHPVGEEKRNCNGEGNLEGKNANSRGREGERRRPNELPTGFRGRGAIGVTDGNSAQEGVEHKFPEKKIHVIAGSRKRFSDTSIN